MKKKYFYSMWAKMLTTAVLLIAGGLTAVCAGWSMAGLSSGMNVNEIMSPAILHPAQTAVRPPAIRRTAVVSIFAHML